MTDYITAQQHWKRFRGTKAAQPVVAELQRMAGERDRCYFCSDSRGVDVEHFEPMKVNFGRSFVWANMLWACAGCNRKKGNRPVLVAGVEKLLNPTTTEPWNHFIFDVATGLLAPRYVGEVPDELAESTLDVLDVLNFESVATGRQRSARRLRQGIQDSAGGDRRPLRRAILDDDYGLARWYSVFDGRDEEPFRLVRLSEPELWRYFIRAAA